MADKMAEVYDAYDVDVLQTSRGRGAIILRTSQGTRQLRPVDVNESRIEAEYRFKEMLAECGYENTDRCVRNKENELLTYDRYGTAYVMRYYYEGRECSTENKTEIIKAVENLALLHKACRQAWCVTENDVHIRQTCDFKKRNQELKRVRNFISRCKTRRQFEQTYVDVFDKYYSLALECEKKYGTINITEDSIHLGYCHGMYNNHSIIINEEQSDIYTTSFDKFYVGNQLADLYHFARKMVEKNDYSIELLVEILNEYNKYCPLDRQDYEYIYILFSYPEKFYKVSNQYMNSSKSWISPKMLDKLNRIIENDEKKQKLLCDMGNIFLHI